MPFHMVNADLIDCYGSAELMKIFNRLLIGICTHLAETHLVNPVGTRQEGSILLGLNPNILIMFTVDNIDFLNSFAQIFCGNQQLSWHEQLFRLFKG